VQRRGRELGCSRPTARRQTTKRCSPCARRAGGLPRVRRGAPRACGRRRALRSRWGAPRRARRLAALRTCSACRPYRAAVAAVRVLDRAETLAREALVTGNVVGSLLIEDEAQIDNRRLGRALVAACEALGVYFERVDDIVIEADARRVRGLRTARGFVSASVVVNPAGAWAGDLAGVPDVARVPVPTNRPLRFSTQTFMPNLETASISS